MPLLLAGTRERIDLRKFFGRAHRFRPHGTPAHYNIKSTVREIVRPARDARKTTVARTCINGRLGGSVKTVISVISAAIIPLTASYSYQSAASFMHSMNVSQAPIWVTRH